LQYWGRSNTHQHWFAIRLRFGQKFFNVAFCSYLHLQCFNWAAVPGGRISNPLTSQSPIVRRKTKTTRYSNLKYSLIKTKIYFDHLKTMKKIISFIQLVFFITYAFMNVNAQKKNSIKKSNERLGDSLKICDSIYETSIIHSNTAEDTILLNIGNKKNNSNYTILLPRSLSFDYSLAEQTLFGKNICVKGKITSSNGRRNILVSKNEDLKVNDPNCQRWLFYQKVFTPKMKEVYFPPNTTESRISNFFDSTIFVTPFPIDIPDDPRQESKYRDDFYGRVFFKLFTDTPLYVFTNHPERIKNYVSMFSLEKYYRSVGLMWDLNKRVEKKDLKKSYVTSHIGKPDKIELKMIDGKTNEIIHYSRYSLRLFFIENILTNYKLDY
jgi:hypothetical protein